MPSHPSSCRPRCGSAEPVLSELEGAAHTHGDDRTVADSGVWIPRLGRGPDPAVHGGPPDLRPSRAAPGTVGARPARCKFRSSFRVFQCVGREPRQHYGGAFYHFIARGTDRQPISLAESDRRETDNTLLQNKRRVRAPYLTLEQPGAAVGPDASTLSRAADNVARRLALDPELQHLLTEIECSLTLRRD